jgi:hypothetical protein
VVVHTCNPSYSGGWGRRITNLRPAWPTQWESKKKKKKLSWAFNTSYSGTRDWEGHGSKPAQAKNSQNSTLINGWEWWRSLESTNRRITVQADLGINWTLSQKYLMQKGLAKWLMW